IKGNAVPFVPLKDSVRFLKDDENRAVDRSKYVKIQTPQCFDVKQLKSAYEQQYQADITDDASLVEALGVDINLVEGDPENIKITYPEDLTFAEALISSH
ncbi:MAG: 2-C-methyl-D-erythritol 4-phosphate cytidylyltransferase, partial [Bacteroidia bacterium]|nr:2-C-methyl-D-erythritol 4-phosphate cytidylyltransferase [Bacteroidia bacterium]